MSETAIQLSLGTVAFPLTPDRLSVVAGAVVQTINLLDLGVVSFPRGYQPTKISFDGMFPGPDRATLAFLNSWSDPLELVRTIDTYRREGTAVSLSAPPLPLDLSVYVDSFTWHASGGFGDIDFSLALTELRSITVMTQGSSAVAARPDLPLLPATYTVRTGQSLSVIAKFLYDDSNLWQTLYQANRALFDGVPGAGDPLTAGIVLTVPGGGGA